MGFVAFIVKRRNCGICGLYSQKRGLEEAYILDKCIHILYLLT